MPREHAFCSYNISEINYLEIPNLEKDIRFKNNPMVKGKEHFRFYADIPLSSPEGFKIGSLCLIDHKPRKLSEKQREILKRLSQTIMALFEAKREIAQDIKRRDKSKKKLKQITHQLESSIKELQERKKESQLLTEMSRIFQSCLSIEEALVPLTNFCCQLFPNTSGTIYLLQEPYDHLESIAVWGKKSTDSNHFFSLNDCWALRLGRAYKADGPFTGLTCRHITNPKHSSRSVCVPLAAQGETFGLFHVEMGSLKNKSQLTSLINQLYLSSITVAEQVALGLANIKLRENLHLRSTHDPLTNLYNRRYLEEWFTAILHRSKHIRSSLAIIMIDVDHFKDFNNTFGHDVGDVVLRQVGKILYKSCRKYDIASRFGGEEFILILANVSPEAAFKRAEELRKTVKGLKLKINNNKIENIKLSIGIANFPDDGDKVATLIKAADTALYQAKAKGRDCVVMSGSRH